MLVHTSTRPAERCAAIIDETVFNDKISNRQRAVFPELTE